MLAEAIEAVRSSAGPTPRVSEVSAYGVNLGLGDVVVAGKFLRVQWSAEGFL